MVGVIFVYADTVFGFYGYSFSYLVGCFSMIIWTTAILSVLYGCALYFCICTCLAQLNRFHMERRSRNTLIIFIYYYYYYYYYDCFPSLPLMLQCGFESRLGLVFSGFGMWHFLKLVTWGFSRVLRFPPLLHRFNGSANKIKLN